MPPPWLFRRYAFGCRRVLAMLDPAGMAERFNARLNGSALLPKVVTGVQFIDGEELEQQAA
jgi:hypothetical protein